MPKPRTPTAVLELKGAFKKNPDRGRARKDEPEPKGPLGDPPVGMQPNEVATWLELASMAPERVLTVADRWIVERACKLMALSRKSRLSVGQESLLSGYLSKMGLTPSDRSKVSVSKEEKPSNTFSRIAQQVRPAQVN